VLNTTPHPIRIAEYNLIAESLESDFQYNHPVRHAARQNTWKLILRFQSIRVSQHITEI
jgi:hypothetical protein